VRRYQKKYLMVFQRMEISYGTTFHIGISVFERFNTFFAILERMTMVSMSMIVATPVRIHREVRMENTNAKSIAR